MYSSVTVLDKAKDISLITLYEARLALGLTTSSNTVLDDQLEMMIEWSSAEIAAICNRTFAKETVTETFRPGDVAGSKIILSRWPVVSIISVTDDDVALVNTDYEMDKESGHLLRLNTDSWGITKVTYTGGYDLPNGSPKALRQATMLMTREAYFASIRGDASVRSVSHKDSRVMYFDPNAALKALSGGGGSGGGSPARRAIGDLLKHYTSFWV